VRDLWWICQYVCILFPVDLSKRSSRGEQLIPLIFTYLEEHRVGEKLYTDGVTSDYAAVSL